MSALSNVQKWAEITRQTGFPKYEDILRTAYSRFLSPGDIAFDVGAHWGEHTHSLLELVGSSGRIVCFEPLPRYAAELRNKFPSATVREVALSDSAGTATFVDVENDPAYSGLRERVYDRPDPIKNFITVQTSTIDVEAPSLDRLNFIKLDIEGGEIDALRGGSKTLNRLRPVLSIEYGSASYCGYGHEAGTLFDLLTTYDYVLADLWGELISSRNEWLNVVDKVYWDFFGVPSSNAKSWAVKVSSIVPK